MPHQAVKPNGGDGPLVLLHVQKAFVPQKVIDRISQMILDKRTGYVRLSLRNGRITGTHIEEVITTR